MKRSILAGASALVVAVGLLASGFIAGRPEAATADAGSVTLAAAETAPSRLEMEGVIRDYLIKNPEILLEMQHVLEEKQKEEQRIAHLEVIRSARGEIFNSAHDGIVGNPDGKTTIVEFFDYNCGFCKRAQQDMQALTAADPELRFVLKEFPILGPDSQKAHVVSMAFRALMPEKYDEFHNQLLGGTGRAGEASAMKIALSLGADEAKLREEMKNPAIMQAFEETYDLASRLSITGTPSYVVGNEVVFGALGREVLGEKIALAKSCADATC
jgi:protein-disulfide isomerase